MCYSPGSPWEGGTILEVCMGSRNRENVFLASSVQPQEGCRTLEKKWVHGASCWRGLSQACRIFNALMRHEVCLHVALCPRGCEGNGGCSWTWRGHAKRVKDVSVNTSIFGGMTLRTRFLTPSTPLPPLHTLHIINSSQTLLGGKGRLKPTNPLILSYWQWKEMEAWNKN